MLTRLNPKKTERRAPGPGAMRTADWKPLAEKHLANRNVVLHTDGARAYSMSIDGMVHDHVVHKKTKLKVNGKFVKKDGKFVWIKPAYVQVFKHKVAGGRTITCKGGTQIIDRFWRSLRSFLLCRKGKVGSQELRRRIRSAQWAYWHAGKDQWLETGRMLQRLQ